MTGEDPPETRKRVRTMSKLLSKKEGFTLIELMIVVAIIGILSAIAIPAFINYVKRSKTTEASLNLKNLFQGAATYYKQPQWPQGAVVTVGAVNSATECIVAPAQADYVATDQKRIHAWNLDNDGPSYDALNFAPQEPVYYQYDVASIAAVGGSCGVASGLPAVYTFRAYGDLDGDAVFSTYEMAVGSSLDNALMRAPGIYSASPLE